jgi:hypothetical protein
VRNSPHRLNPSMGFGTPLALVPVLLVLIWPVLAGAETDRCATEPTRDCTYNPHPAGDDFSLPMPGGMEMVFRKVVVPGEEFWGNPERLVSVGDVRDDYGDEDKNSIYEGVERLLVYGAFYDRKARNWYYYLQKYELTIAQYVAVMGEGDEPKGLEELYRRSRDSALVQDLRAAVEGPSPVAKYRLMARPMASISWLEFQELITRYNLWCLNDTECAKRLPKLPPSLRNEHAPGKAMPGFVRLPTELEWEYAARGGHSARAMKTRSGSSRYEDSLPFPKGELADYAWTNPHSKSKQTKRIGRWKPSFGFYDMFGNVQELTSGLFATEMNQGKVGALAARGGSYLDDMSRVRVSLRTEVPLYRSAEGEFAETRSPTNGVRLAIGSVVITNTELTDEIAREYRDYSAKFRRETAAGRSMDAELVKGMDSLSEVADRIDHFLADGGSGSRSELRTIRKALSGVQRELSSAVKENSRLLVTIALESVTRAGEHEQNIARRERLVRRLEAGGEVSVITRGIIDLKKGEIATRTRYFHILMSRYARNVTRLSGYPEEVVEVDIGKVEAEHRGEKGFRRFVNLFNQHLKQAREGVSRPEAWAEEVKKLAREVYGVG